MYFNNIVFNVIFYDTEISSNKFINVRYDFYANIGIFDYKLPFSTLTICKQLKTKPFECKYNGKGD